MQTELKNKLMTIIQEVSEIDDIPVSAAFADLGIDSMTAIEIVAEVEREFSIRVPEDDLEELSTFQAVYDKVESLMN